MASNYYISRYVSLDEASYNSNIGFEELVEFYGQASDQEIFEMEDLLQREMDDEERWEEFKKLVKKVLGKDLI